MNEGANAGRNCPACGSTRAILFKEDTFNQTKLNPLSFASRKPPEFMSLELVKCLACSLVYAPEPVAPEELAGLYAAAEYDTSEEAGYAAQTYARELEAIPGFDSVPRLGAIDIGAGNGALLPHLEKMGFNPVIGFEPSRRAAEHAAPGVRDQIVVAPFNVAACEPGANALVTTFMTLEHVADPRILAKDVFDILAPGGLFVVVVHDWQAPLNRALGKRSPIIDIEHMQLFSRASTASLLSNVGFRTVNVKRIANRYPLNYWARLTPVLGARPATTKILRASKAGNIPITLPVGNLIAWGFRR